MNRSLYDHYRTRLNWIQTDAWTLIRGPFVFEALLVAGLVGMIVFAGLLGALS